MKKFYIAALVVVFTGLGRGEMKSSVSQWGITWTFSKSYETGQFVNGDWWVVVDAGGTVVINSITPAFSGGRNGWEVNPTHSGSQGFDSRSPGYNASLVPGLPYTAHADESVVKAVSGDYTGKTFLQTAAVLTVLSAVPDGNGAAIFRPPYFGTQKPFYLRDSLHTELLPSLATVPGAPTLAQVESKFQRVHLTHISDWMGDQIRPVDNYLLTDPYGANIATDAADAALRLMLNDAVSAKLNALIYYVQAGIDYYHMARGGTTWPANGGHGNGEKLPLTFAAVMLNDQPMQDYVKNVPHGGAPKFDEVFGEDGMIYRGRDGVVLYGKIDPYGSESYYWQDLVSFSDKTYRDPYGIIDGGSTPGGIYQSCCNSMPWKYTALVLTLLPELRPVWNNDQIIEYADRWVNQGAHTQPDPCAPVSQGGGPKGDGTCILDPDLTTGSTFTNFTCQAGKECGRFPELEGSNKNSGARSSVFGDFMWKNYRNYTGVPDRPAVEPQPARPVISISPNPFRAGRNPLVITSQITGMRHPGIVVYDATGKAVRHLNAPGDTGVQWDGRNDNGRCVPGGAYYLRLTGRPEQTIHTVVVMPE